MVLLCSAASRCPAYIDALTYTVGGLDFETRAALPPGEADVG